MLITLDQARQHLRVDGTDDAADLQLKVNAAQQLAVEYLNRAVYATQPELDAAVLAGTAGPNTPMVCNDLVRAAILLTLGHLYANREEVVTGTIATELPMGSRTLLAPYRKGMGV